MRDFVKARSLAAGFLLASALGGCASDAPPPVDTGVNAPIVDLPERHGTVSGLLYDPEAFFVHMLTFPTEPGQEDMAPPPALFDGIPYLVFSAIPGAQVRLSSPGLPEVSSGPSAFTGHWQVNGVALSEGLPYVAEAIPPAEGVTLIPGAPFPLPPADYFPTRTLRPIQVNVTECSSQTALMVGNTGGLDAVAQYLTMEGTETTVADLLDPAKTGGVVLFWVHAPSFYYDYFLIPQDTVAAESSAGQVIPLMWAPPEGFPGQSPMGFFAMPGPVSFLGYFALVLPPGQTEPVTVSFTDVYEPEEGEEPGPFGPRPLPIPPAVVEPHPGVSVQRVFAFPNMGPPPPDPLEAPGLPPMDERWRCEPSFPEE